MYQNRKHPHIQKKKSLLGYYCKTDWRLLVLSHISAYVFSADVASLCWVPFSQGNVPR